VRSTKSSRFHDMLGAAARSGTLARIAGVHDGLSTMIAERACMDGLWASGLGISTVNGLPDAGLLTMTELAATVACIRRCSALPLIADCDAGFGDVNVVQRMVRLFEDAGADAVCIEDKQYPKRNSFLDDQVLEDVDAFAYKIWAAKNAQCSDDFAVIARLESLIAGHDVDEALQRAEAYLAAGADALLIHSKSADVEEISEFVRRARAMSCAQPIFVVPTTYYRATTETLAALGVTAAIYANQLLRASMTAMVNVLSVLERDCCTTRIEPDIASVHSVLDICGTQKLLSTVAPRHQEDHAGRSGDSGDDR
jgi:phosphoenolpyruvate phosphomutase